MGDNAQVDGDSRVSAELRAKTSTVYGPVDSWRVGRSPGVDLLCVDSVCSFRCVYCQLGRINMHTAERRVYVPTTCAVRPVSTSSRVGDGEKGKF